MSWQLLTLLSIVLFSLNSLFHKVIMREEQSDPYAQTIAFYGLVGIISLFIAIFNGGFQYKIPLQLLPYFIPLACFSTVAPVLLFHSIKRIDASEVSILVSTQRLWIVIAAFILLNEPFSYNKLLGTIVILIGISIALWKKNRFVLNKEILYVLLAAIMYGLAETTSYFILRSVDALSFIVYVSLIPAILLTIIKPRSIKKLKFYLTPKLALAIILVSLNDVLASLFGYLAYQIGRNASQIAPLLATNTMLSVILAIIILRERTNVANKIIGATIVVCGLILVLRT